jgi:hypothetical protein
MGIQDSLTNASAKVQRRLFDLNIKLTGREVQGLRFYVAEEDKYGDENEIRHISSSPITAIVNFPPGDIPLYRLRGETSGADVDDSGLFFYDILPIEVYCQWQDKVEKGDFLVFSIQDENNKAMPVLLRFSNALGSFHTHLIWRKFMCAPYNGKAPVEIQNYIDANF